MEGSILSYKWGKKGVWMGLERLFGGSGGNGALKWLKNKGGPWRGRGWCVEKKRDGCGGLSSAKTGKTAQTLRGEKKPSKSLRERQQEREGRFITKKREKSRMVRVTSSHARGHS